MCRDCWCRESRKAHGEYSHNLPVPTSTSSVGYDSLDIALFSLYLTILSLARYTAYLIGLGGTTSRFLFLVSSVFTSLIFLVFFSSPFQAFCANILRREYSLSAGGLCVTLYSSYHSRLSATMFRAFHSDRSHNASLLARLQLKFISPQPLILLTRNYAQPESSSMAISDGL
jgi:hypothetical protein